MDRSKNRNKIYRGRYYFFIFDLNNEFPVIKHPLSFYSVNNIHLWLSKVKEKIFEEIKFKDVYFS